MTYQTVSEKYSGNTVAGEQQIIKSQYVSFGDNSSASGGLLCAGCSITCHGPKPDIGWNGNWGMAATSQENDYVHSVWSALRKVHSNAGLCVAQTAHWERNFVDGKNVLKEHYSSAREFSAQWIVVTSAGNNAPPGMMSDNSFIRHYEELINFFNPSGTAKVVLASSIYDIPMNADIKDFARRNGYTYVDLYSIMECPGMRAIGLWEHSGVASHPSDEGMMAIAREICEIFEL